MFGDTYNYGDINKVEKLGYADFWTYSFPCQDISVSGKQAGINKNTRSGLLYQVERLLDVAKQYDELPKYLMLENVKNLVGKKFKKQFDEWLEYLNELGYNNYWQVLNAKDYGIPQNRERVFAISIRKDIDNYKFKFPKGFDNGKRLKDILEEKVDEKYYIRRELEDKFKEQIANKEISNTIRVGGQGNVDRHSRDLAADNSLQQVGTLKGCGMPYNKMHDQSGRVYDPDGIAPTIHTCGGGNLEPKILQKSRGFNKGGLHEISPTISSHSWECNNLLTEPCIAASRGRNPDNPSDRTVGNPTEQRLEINSKGICNTITTVQKDCLVIEPNLVIGSTQKNAFIGNGEHSSTLTSAMCEGGGHIPMIGFTDFKIRKLTPLECWRLMGFDDDDFYKAQKGINDTFHKGRDRANSQLYKQAGNSIVVDVLYHIFKNAFSKYIITGEGATGNFTQPPILQTTPSSLAV